MVIAEMQNARPEWVDYIECRCEELNIDDCVIKAMCFRESSWNPTVGTTHLGLMQISNSCSIESDLLHPINNIKIGTDKLNGLIATYQNTVDALNRYNGIDKDGWTTYSTNVYQTAEKIFMSERKRNFEKETEEKENETRIWKGYYATQSF